MAGLRTSKEIVVTALEMLGEGMGVKASSRVLDKSHSTIWRWEDGAAGDTTVVTACSRSL